MPVKFSFDAEKALEALVYICKKTGTDLYGALKILYSADKLHLHRYGRFIAGDYYKRLRYGPIPQGAYDILHFVRGEHSVSPVPDARKALRFHGQTKIEVLRDPDLDALSQTDIECLDVAIERDGNKSFGEHKKGSHDAAYEATRPNSEIAVEAIASMAEENREALLQYLADRYPDRAC
jgi:hypothetical protein